MTATVAAMLSTMLMFRFEGHESATRKELAVAWLPLILLDVAIVEFLVGLMVWYSTKSLTWRWAMVLTNLVVELIVAIVIAVWMWKTMSVKGGLGEEETYMDKVVMKKKADE